MRQCTVFTVSKHVQTKHCLKFVTKPIT